jgi:hypothetical protein
MDLREDFMSKLKSAIPKQMSSAGVFNSGVEGGNIEAIKSINTYNRELSEEPNNGETDEGMGAASAGGYSTQLFSATKKDIEDITKVEATEATGSVSSGSYLTTAAWAKSTKKKDWRGKSKTQIPGGKFVQVKKKCKKFPYCNQGDINALKLTNEGIVDNVIKKLSEKYNLSESVIRTILKNHLNQNK